MDVGNISDREFQIELLRSVLKLPEDLITKIVGLAYEEALEHIIEVFTVYDVKTKTFSRQTDSARIKERHYTDIDSYNIIYVNMISIIAQKKLGKFVKFYIKNLMLTVKLWI